MNLIKVASNSRSTSVAGAIAGIVREQGRVDVQAIGAGAVNQAVKAIAIARGYLEGDGIDIFCVPSFSEVMIDSKERTAVRLAVESTQEEELLDEGLPDMAFAPSIAG
jgi:stage V sporulation protein S